MSFCPLRGEPCIVRMHEVRGGVLASGAHEIDIRPVGDARTQWSSAFVDLGTFALRSTRSSLKRRPTSLALVAPGRYEVTFPGADRPALRAIVSPGSRVEIDKLVGEPR